MNESGEGLTIRGPSLRSYQRSRSDGPADTRLSHIKGGGPQRRLQRRVKRVRHLGQIHLAPGGLQLLHLRGAHYQRAEPMGPGHLARDLRLIHHGLAAQATEDDKHMHHGRAQHENLQQAIQQRMDYIGTVG